MGNGQSNIDWSSLILVLFKEKTWLLVKEKKQTEHVFEVELGIQTRGSLVMDVFSCHSSNPVTAVCVTFVFVY